MAHIYYNLYLNGTLEYQKSTQIAFFCKFLGREAAKKVIKNTTGLAGGGRPITIAGRYKLI